MSIYEVFQRKGPTDAMTHVGSVNADDTRLALLLAKECYFRRDNPGDVWVVRREDVHHLDETDVLQPGTDKSYRSIEAYKGIARKRERIEAEIAGSRQQAVQAVGSKHGQELQR